jgi:hypothetical protein
MWNADVIKGRSDRRSRRDSAQSISLCSRVCSTATRAPTQARHLLVSPLHHLNPADIPSTR